MSRLWPSDHWPLSIVSCSLAKFVAEEAVDGPVAEFAVDQFRFAEGPFQFEAKALGYRAAPDVRGVAADLDAIKLHCIKQIIDQHPRGPGYYPLALVGFVDPITDRRASVCGVES